MWGGIVSEIVALATMNEQTEWLVPPPHEGARRLGINENEIGCCACTRIEKLELLELLLTTYIKQAKTPKAL